MSHALLAIQNILQNSNIFIGSRETVLFTPFSKKKVTQFSGVPPTSVSYLNPSHAKLFCTHTPCQGGVETTPLLISKLFTP